MVARSRGFRTKAAAAVAAGLVPLCASAQEHSFLDWPTMNFYGSPGIVDMPEGRPLADGEMVTSASTFAGITRGTFTAQIHPRLAGSFRYTEIQDFDSAGFSTYYDRSFDLRFTVLQESRALPAVTLGLQDFIGTGIYSGEYVAATKTLTRRLQLTGGLGWGRLSGNKVWDGIGEREDLTPEEVAEGGEPNLDSFFRGPVGAFGGIAWRPIDQVVLKLEYSSDRYDLESSDLDVFDRKQPWNYGIEYQPFEGMQIGAYYLYGSQIGLRFSLNFNPNRPATNGSIDSAPAPIIPRPSREARPEIYATGWSDSVETRDDIRERLAKALAEDRLEIEALKLEPGSAVLYVRNSGYQAQAQAWGRAARHMARLLPSSIETFTVVPQVKGQELPALSFRRSDLERLETAPDGAEQMLAATTFTDGFPNPRADEFADDVYPRFIWRVAPYAEQSFFDPDQPLRIDFGAELSALIEVAPGLQFGGAVRKKIVGNLGDNRRESNSQLPHVRSDFPLYDRYGDPGIENLYGAYYFQPAPEFYGRVTAGYLERMFAGVSSELLWAPYDSALALGAELNYVEQRDFEGGFGLQDYDVVTGHVSAYYRVTDDFYAELAVGRYLAGDDGATLAVSRVFANGWRVGAFATKTDVTASEFGEGSFDKGITLSIPLGWFTGKSSPVVAPVAIRPLQRDGGARLIVPGRLYPLVDNGQRPRVEEQWGRFWR